MSDYILGIDEAGLGPLAGPIGFGAVLFGQDTNFDGLNDSKKLSAKRRAAALIDIGDHAVWGTYELVEVSVIRTLGLREAWRHGIRTMLRDFRAMLLDGLVKGSIEIIVDGNVDFALAREYPDIQFIKKADETFPAVMAASIMAKTQRDAVMLRLDKQYPEYGFAKHKGYGTKEHIAALERHGITPHHRPTRRTPDGR